MENPIQEIRISGMSVSQFKDLLREEGQRIIKETNIIKAAEELPEQMTQKQVAEYWQVTPKTVLSWESKGILKRYPLKGTDSFRYKKIEVLAINK